MRSVNGCRLGFLTDIVMEGDDEVVGFLLKLLSILKSQDLLEKRGMDFAQFVHTRNLDTRLCKFQTWESGIKLWLVLYFKFVWRGRGIGYVNPLMETPGQVPVDFFIFCNFS